jgi:DNA-binding transcriptional MerR regulator
MAKGVTRTELAEIIGINQETVRSRYSFGFLRPSGGEPEGRGWRRYSFLDVLYAKILATLGNRGFEYQRIMSVAKELAVEIYDRADGKLTAASLVAVFEAEEGYEWQVILKAKDAESFDTASNDLRIEIAKEMLTKEMNAMHRSKTGEVTILSLWQLEESLGQRITEIRGLLEKFQDKELIKA